jgi:hypothetical protein
LLAVVNLHLPPSPRLLRAHDEREPSANFEVCDRPRAGLRNP